MTLKRVTYILRLVTLVATTVFALISLIIAITQLDAVAIGIFVNTSIAPQASFVLAAAVLTIVFQTPMFVVPLILSINQVYSCNNNIRIAIDFFRIGAFTSWVVVELVVLGNLLFFI
jgi:hypothetical protein